jgi:hypothetical protein
METDTSDGLTAEWLKDCDEFECLGDDPPRLLASCGDWRRQGWVSISGEIRDGRGYHPMATFSHGPHARPGGQLAKASDPIADLRRADLLLRRVGWALLDVAINEQTGYVRIIAEARDHERGRGTMVTILRSSHDGVVREIRDRTVAEDGMYRKFWAIDSHLGRRRHSSLDVAARELLAYACDNGPAGALSEAEAQRRRELVESLRALHVGE